MTWQIATADVLDWAAGYTGPKFMALLADAPYHLKGGFMGRDWDKDTPDAISFQPETWKALGQHLLPGAFMMVFGGARTYHRMAVAIEDAGFILHPAIVWVNGSSFPKATRIDTQIDKAAGVEREVVGQHNQTIPQISPRDNFGKRFGDEGNNGKITAPATPLAATWAGHRYGLQSLKPAAEFICVAQKPYAGKPVDSIVQTGAGALNIEEGRIDSKPRTTHKNGNFRTATDCPTFHEGLPLGEYPAASGRWPANFLLSHLPGCRKVGTRRVKASKDTITHTTLGMMNDDSWEAQPTLVKGYADPDGLELVDAWECEAGCPVAALSAQSGERPSGGGNGHRQPMTGSVWNQDTCGLRNGDRITIDGIKPSEGTAARFFFQADWSYEIAERLAGAEPFYYCAKASRRERDAGLEGFIPVEPTYRANGLIEDRTWIDRKDGKGPVPVNARMQPRHNPHPTVKPISLTRYLATLLLPPPAYAPRRILVPFAGVASEMCGAGLAGFEEIIGIEKEPEYVEIGQARLRHWLANMQMELAL